MGFRELVNVFLIFLLGFWMGFLLFFDDGLLLSILSGIISGFLFLIIIKFIERYLDKYRWLKGGFVFLVEFTVSLIILVRTGYNVDIVLIFFSLLIALTSMVILLPVISNYTEKYQWIKIGWIFSVLAISYLPLALLSGLAVDYLDTSGIDEIIFFPLFIIGMIINHGKICSVLSIQCISRTVIIGPFILILIAFIIGSIIGFVITNIISNESQQVNKTQVFENTEK